MNHDEENDRSVEPLPPNPQVIRFEVALQISTGNTIYGEFHDPEETMAFISEFAHNPQAILSKITPKKTDSPG